MNKNNIFTKILKLLPITLFFSLKSLFSIGPLGLVGIPVLGGFLSAKSASAKGMLQEAEKAIFGLKILFLVVAAAFVVISILWIIKFLYKSAKYKRFASLSGLLSRLHADILSLQNSDHINESSLREVKKSRKEVLESLLRKIERKSLKSRLDKHILGRFSDALNMIKDEKISLEDQAKLADQWQRKFLLLAR